MTRSFEPGMDFKGTSEESISDPVAACGQERWGQVSFLPLLNYTWPHTLRGNPWQGIVIDGGAALLDEMIDHGFTMRDILGILFL